MYRHPRRQIANCNNVCTVSLPLTEIDVGIIVERVAAAIQSQSIFLTDLEDVSVSDIEQLEDGSVLAWNATNQKWEATKVITENNFTINNITNVSVPDTPEDKSILAWNAVTQKWESTTINQVQDLEEIDGGFI